MKKKWLSILLVTAMVTSLAACGSKTDNKDAKTDDTSNQEITAAEFADTIKHNAEIYKKYITLPEYKGVSVSVDRSSLNVTDEDVDSYIKSSLSSFATTENIEEGVTSDGDTVTMDYAGTIDGTAFSGGTATDVSYTIGSGQFIDSLDKGLAGLTLNKEYQIPCRFPDDYFSSDLAGKDAVFTVTVKSIQKTTLPELTDAWVAENKDSIGCISENVDGLKQEVRELLTDNNKSTFESNKFSSILSTLEDGAQVSDYPQAETDSLLEVFKNNVKSQYEQYQSYYSASGTDYSYDTYLKDAYNCDSEDAFNDYAIEQCHSYLKQKMIITIVAADNNISASEEEILNEGENWAQYYGFDNYQAIIDQYGNEINTEVGTQVVTDKVQQFLNDNAVETE